MYTLYGRLTVCFLDDRTQRLSSKILDNGEEEEESKAVTQARHTNILVVPRLEDSTKTTHRKKKKLQIDLDLKEENLS